MAADIFGNALLTGEFENTAGFGEKKLVSEGMSDAFVARYDLEGNALFAKGITGVQNNKGLSIASHNSDFFLLGSYEGDIKFDGKIHTGAGGTGLFLVRYRSGGFHDWVRQIKYAEAGNHGNSLAVDDSGNVVVTGFFTGKMVLNDTVLVSRGKSDVFLAKYGFQGNLKWVVQAGGAGADRGLAVGSGPTGKIFVTGDYEGTAQFGGKMIKGPSSCQAPFVACYTVQGDLKWISSARTSLCARGTHLAVDSDGSLIIGGEFHDMAYFRTKTLRSYGKQDIFILNYNSNYGSLNWAQNFGGDGMDILRSLDVNKGAIYAAGNFEGAANFGNELIEAKTKQDMFLACFNNQIQVNWVRQFSGDFTPRAMAAGSAGKLIIAGESRNFNNPLLEPLPFYGGLDVILTEVLVK
jgi:hypothetical protein